jgi:hypothetical protein
MVAIAAAGLRRLRDGHLDAVLLEPVLQQAATGRSPAADMLIDFERAGGDRARLTRAWTLSER